MAGSDKSIRALQNAINALRTNDVSFEEFPQPPASAPAAAAPVIVPEPEAPAIAVPRLEDMPQPPDRTRPLSPQVQRGVQRQTNEILGLPQDTGSDWVNQQMPRGLWKTVPGGTRRFFPDDEVWVDYNRRDLARSDAEHAADPVAAKRRELETADVMPWTGVPADFPQGLPDQRGLSPSRQAAVQKEGARYRAELKARFDAARDGLAAAPESGTLPGEEQVTSRDVFSRLPPAQRSALQARHAASNSGQGFDDYLSENFGDLPPGERAAAMASAASAAPAGMTQQQRQDFRDVTHNFLIPEIPMMPGRGTFVRNPDGSRSLRAPDPRGLAEADKFPTDQMWVNPEFNRVLGTALGVNVNHPRYENNPDQLRDDVLRLWAEHERYGSKTKVEDTGAKLAGNGRFAAPNVTGNLRYVSDPDKAAAVQAEADRARTPKDRARLASDIRARYKDWKDMPPGALERIKSAEMKEDGFAELRQINEELRNAKREQIAGVVRSRRNAENLANDLRNPRPGPGIIIRSLLDEARRNNPIEMAVQYEIAGMPEAAAQMRQLAVAQQQGATQLAMQGQQLAAAASGDPTLAGQFAAQRRAIFAQAQTPAERLGMMKDVLFRQQTREGAPPPDDKVITSQARRLVAEHMVRINPQDPSVQDYLQSLSDAGNKNEFISFLTSDPLRVPLEEAERRWAASGGMGWAGMYRQAERGVNAAGRAMRGQPGNTQAGR